VEHEVKEDSAIIAMGNELGSALVLLPFFKPACEKSLFLAGKGHYLACCSQTAKRP
jgi:hypothetical protein